MAAVQTKGEVLFNRAAIAAVLIATFIMLIPIFWIGATAFKPRNLATTIPPTVFFQPELSPFVKLFLKRFHLMLQRMSKVALISLSYLGFKEFNLLFAEQSFEWAFVHPGRNLGREARLFLVSSIKCNG